MSHILLPPRRAEVVSDTDVLVVGGGPAGFAAAIGAAECGARVVIAERYGFLGGNATAGLVIPMMSYHTQNGREPLEEPLPLMPRDHGPGDPVIAGVLARLVLRMNDMGGVLTPSPRTGYTLPFDPEIFKLAASDLLEESGAQLLLHALAVSPVYQKNKIPSARAYSVDTSKCARMEGVVFETKSGAVVVKAKCVVDCTGDGDVAAFGGAPFEVGREEDGLVQPMSLMFRMGGFEQSAFSRFVRENPEEWEGVQGLSGLVRKAAAEGELDLLRDNVLMFRGVRSDEVCVNSTRVCGMLGLNVLDLTRAELMARKQMRQITMFLKKRVPGFEKSHILQSATSIGVRETRRIMGEYRLEERDVMQAAKFDDVIAKCPYPIDIHDPQGSGTQLQRLPEGESYDIPLRSLIPLEVENLLLAGRCISGSHEAHSSYRVMPVSMATGQAAGVCAAIAADEEMFPREVHHSFVQAELVRQGAFLGDFSSARACAPCCKCVFCRVA